MKILRPAICLGLALLFSSVSFPLNAIAQTDEPGKTGSFYSPIIRVVPDKGFLMISTNGGILWVRASEAAFPHIEKLPVGGLIDIVVEFQGKPNPPIIKSWKLASGDSECNIFDGATCVQAVKEK
jgi:hypothetical protein